MKQENTIHISVKAELLWLTSQKEWNEKILSLNLDDNTLIIGVNSEGIVLDIGEDITDPEYNVSVYQISDFGKAYDLGTLKRMSNIQLQGETLADDIITLNAADQLPEEIIQRMKSLLESAHQVGYKPDKLTKSTILNNFVTTCLKRGMTSDNPCYDFVLQFDNWNQLIGKEA